MRSRKIQALTYKQTMKALWSFIGERSTISLVVNRVTVANFRVQFLEPPPIPKLPWSRAKNLPALGPLDHAIRIDPDNFTGARYLHAGEILSIDLKNGIQLIVAVPDSHQSS